MQEFLCQIGETQNKNMYRDDEHTSEIIPVVHESKDFLFLQCIWMTFSYWYKICRFINFKKLFLFWQTVRK